MNAIKQKIRAFRKDVTSAWNEYLEAEKKLFSKPNENTLKDLFSAAEIWKHEAKQHLNYLQYLRECEWVQQGLWGGDEEYYNKKIRKTYFMTDYYYSGFGGCKSVCDLCVDKSNNIIVFTEKGDNEGTSITNMIEDLANSVADKYRLDKDVITCFEIYNEESYNGRNREGSPSITLVQFNYSNGRLTQPQWSYYEPGEFVDFLSTAKSPLTGHFKIMYL